MIGLDKNNLLLIFLVIFFIFFINKSTLANQNLELVDIWDIKLGMMYSDIPTKDFMFFACGTNGGPPSRPLKNKFEDYHLCKSDKFDLKEVYFEYDDEAYFWAMAQNDTHSAGFQGTKVFSHPVILSLLFDDDGVVKGVRIVTDDRATHRERMGATALFIKFENIFGKDPWECIDHDPADGESPVAGRFIKKSCIKFKNDKTILLMGNYFRKKGQKTFDPVTKKPTTGYFESKTMLEVYSNDISINNNLFVTEN